MATSKKGAVLFPQWSRTKGLGLCLIHSLSQNLGDLKMYLTSVNYVGHWLNLFQFGQTASKLS